MIKCPSCGAQVAEDDHFCPYCGAKIKEEEKPQEETHYSDTYYEHHEYGDKINDNTLKLGAIAGFVGVIFPIIGIILAIVAIKRSEDELAKKQAIVGIIVSVVSFLMHASFYITAFGMYGWFERSINNF